MVWHIAFPKILRYSIPYINKLKVPGKPEEKQQEKKICWVIPRTEFNKLKEVLLFSSLEFPRIWMKSLLPDLLSMNGAANHKNEPWKTSPVNEHRGPKAATYSLFEIRSMEKSMCSFSAPNSAFQHPLDTQEKQVNIRHQYLKRSVMNKGVI